MSDSDNNVPTVIVETDNAKITVTDERTAEAAMPFIVGTLEYYLDRNSHTPRAQHQPVEVECDKCGYEWEYRGSDPRRSTCPDCNKTATFDPPLNERGVR